MTRREAASVSAIARWCAARPAGDRLAALVGDARAAVRVVGVTAGGGRPHPDPHAARAELRVGGLTVVIAGAARAVRALAQRVLGGPDELDAPRPLAAAESAIWAVVVAAALEDAGIPGEVWPVVDTEGARNAGPDADAVAVELAATLGDLPITVVAWVPAALELRAPPPRPYPAWRFALRMVRARAALPRATVAALRVGDVITVEAAGAADELELVIGPGHVRVRAAPGALEAAVVTGYVRRAMALPDDAHLELTVELGATHLSVRRLAELAVGEVIPLGRPLAGPYEVRAGGQIVGQGELVDIDGELGVRIVSLTPASPEIAQE